MKKHLSIIGFVCSATVFAQPGIPMPFWDMDPCGMPPNDSVDVDLDGIADLLITGWVVGTDDVPSSSGSCTRVVSTLPGTTLLCTLDGNLQRVPKYFAPSDTVPAFWNEIQNDHLLPEWAFAEATIIAVSWGYGGQWSEPTADPNLSGQVFVFQTFRNERVVHSSFTIDVRSSERMVRIVPGAFAGDVGPLILR